MVVPEYLAAGVLFVAMVMYAVFAGADFGSGIWTALAFGPRARQQQRSLSNAIGPVWETNHVWIIFVVVTLFTAFPHGFQAIFIALLVPFVIALIGINFRGAAFAFGHFGQQTSRRLPATSQVFSISSLLTPFTLGMAVTALAAGKIQIANGQVQNGPFSGWISIFTVVGGLIGLTMCALLAPVYMTVRTEGGLREDFRKMGLAAAAGLGVLTTAEILVAWFDAPLFFQRLVAPLPLAAAGVAVILGLVTFGALWVGRYHLAQVAAAGTVTLTLLGFALALFPDLILGQMTFTQASAPTPTLVAYLTALPFGALILVPSLFLLYWTFRGNPSPQLHAGGTEVASSPEQSVK